MTLVSVSVSKPIKYPYIKLLTTTLLIIKPVDKLFLNTTYQLSIIPSNHDGLGIDFYSHLYQIISNELKFE